MFKFRIFRVQSRRQIIQLYVDVNKAQPVQEIDVPDAISTRKKRCIDEACAALKDKYSLCFSTKLNCRAPNVHRKPPRRPSLLPMQFALPSHETTLWLAFLSLEIV